MTMRRLTALALGVAVVAAAPAAAATPREMLMVAAFQTADRKAALELVNGALGGATAALAANPRDREALMQRAIATGYRARLTQGAADAKSCKRQFDALAAADPRDPEAQAAVAGWHLDSIDQLGAFLARMGLGAQRAPGLAALDRAVALGGGRAFFAGFAALERVRLDPGDTATPLKLALAAQDQPTPTPLDRLFKRKAAELLPALKAGNGKAAATLARRLLPFGQLR